MRSYDVDSADLFEEEELKMLEKTVKEDQWSELLTVEEFLDRLWNDKL